MYQLHVIAYIEFMLAEMQRDLISRGYKLSYHLTCTESVDMSKLYDASYQYLVIHTVSGSIVGYCKSLKAACRSCDRRDLEYGAKAYHHMNRLWYLRSLEEKRKAQRAA